jgi:voltage-gated potassium channel Kch
MTWLSVLGSVLYYLSLPFKIIFDWLLVALAPVLHLGHYLLSAFLFPLRILAKFEVGENILFIVPC